MYVPRARPGLVVRARLLERLAAGAAARLVLVSAPPGFGKTTLLAEWVRAGTVERRVAWLSLDAGDNDPGSFWSAVVALLEVVVPGLGASCREFAVAGQGPTPEAITLLLNELTEATDDVWLVLDDCHLVDDRDVKDGVRFCWSICRRRCTS